MVVRPPHPPSSIKTNPSKARDLVRSRVAYKLSMVRLARFPRLLSRDTVMRAPPRFTVPGAGVWQLGRISPSLDHATPVGPRIVLVSACPTISLVWSVSPARRGIECEEMLRHQPGK